MARRLCELAIPPDRLHLVVRVGVEMGIERKDYDRELVSQLLSRLFGEHLTRVEVARGFELMLERVDDLTVDNPQAPTLLAAFLVRAVSDDLLPPAFVRTTPAEALSSQRHRDTLTHARAQLDATHFSGHRAKVQGPADASLPTLKEAVTEVAREYFVSCELSEVRRVRERQAPRFHHEVVKRLLVIALDGGAAHVALAEQLVLRLCSEASCRRSSSLAASGLSTRRPTSPDNPQTPTMLADFLHRFCERAPHAGGRAKTKSPHAQLATRRRHAACEAQAMRGRHADSPGERHAPSLRLSRGGFRSIRVERTCKFWVSCQTALGRHDSVAGHPDGRSLM